MVGDGIWALRNAYIPFVLRPAAMETIRMGEEDRQFQVIGPCFILDLIQGEMVADASKEQIIGII